MELQLDSLQCPICLDTFSNPTTTACGHSFCIEHISPLKIPVMPSSFSLKCPYCNVVHVYDKELSVNFTLKSIIDELGNKNLVENTDGKKIEKFIPLREKKDIVRIKEDGVWGRKTCIMLQQFLNAHGASLLLDGFIGKISVCALQRFICNYGILPVDGYFGEMTFGALQKLLQQSGFSPGIIDGDFGKQSTRALQKWLNHEVGQSILKVDGLFGVQTAALFQSVLKKKGYDTRGVDGNFGKMSIKALQRFLNDRGCCYIIVDGVWGEVTTCALQVWLIKNKEDPGPVDGIWASMSCLAMQRLLNKWITGEKTVF